MTKPNVEQEALRELVERIPHHHTVIEGEFVINCERCQFDAALGKLFLLPEGVGEAIQRLRDEPRLCRRHGWFSTLMEDVELVCRAAALAPALARKIEEARREGRIEQHMAECLCCQHHLEMNMTRGNYCSIFAELERKLS